MSSLSDNHEEDPPKKKRRAKPTQEEEEGETPMTMEAQLTAIRVELVLNSAVAWPVHHALLALLRDSSLHQNLYDQFCSMVSTELQLQNGRPIEPAGFLCKFRKKHRKDARVKDLLRILCQYNAFWDRILTEGAGPTFGNTSTDIETLVSNYASDEIRSDRALMARACRVEPKCLLALRQAVLWILPFRRFQPSPLAFDRTFIREVLAHHPSALKYVASRCTDRDLLADVLANNPAALQYAKGDALRRYPDLVMETMAVLGADEQLSTSDAQSIGASIDERLWNDRTMVLQWFRSGLPFFEHRSAFNTHPHPFNALRNDSEVFLLIAKHSRSPGESFFRYASMTLRANKEFMMQAVKQNTSLFSCASTDLKRDFDLALIAFAADDLDVVERTFSFRCNFHVSFLRQVQAMLCLHETFCVMLSCSGSTLAVLNQGTETVLVYKQLIAEFLGVPTGNMDLPLLRRAYSNLKALQV